MGGAAGSSPVSGAAPSPAPADAREERPYPVPGQITPVVPGSGRIVIPFRDADAPASAPPTDPAIKATPPQGIRVPVEPVRSSRIRVPYRPLGQAQISEAPLNPADRINSGVVTTLMLIGASRERDPIFGTLFNNATARPITIATLIVFLQLQDGYILGESFDIASYRNMMRAKWGLSEAVIERWIPQEDPTRGGFFTADPTNPSLGFLTQEAVELAFWWCTMRLSLILRGTDLPPQAIACSLAKVLQTSDLNRSIEDPALARQWGKRHQDLVRFYESVGEDYCGESGKTRNTPLAQTDIADAQVIPAVEKSQAPMETDSVSPGTVFLLAGNLATNNDRPQILWVRFVQAAQANPSLDTLVSFYEEQALYARLGTRALTILYQGQTCTPYDSLPSAAHAELEAIFDLRLAELEAQDTAKTLAAFDAFYLALPSDIRRAYKDSFTSQHASLDRKLKAGEVPNEEILAASDTFYASLASEAQARFKESFDTYRQTLKAQLDQQREERQVRNRKMLDTLSSLAQTSPVFVQSLTSVPSPGPENPLRQGLRLTNLRLQRDLARRSTAAVTTSARPTPTGRAAAASPAAPQYLIPAGLKSLLPYTTQKSTSATDSHVAFLDVTIGDKSLSDILGATDTVNPVRLDYERDFGFYIAYPATAITDTSFTTRAAQAAILVFMADKRYLTLPQIGATAGSDWEANIWDYHDQPKMAASMQEGLKNALFGDLKPGYTLSNADILALSELFFYSPPLAYWFAREAAKQRIVVPTTASAALDGKPSSWDISAEQKVFIRTYWTAMAKKPVVIPEPLKSWPEERQTYCKNAIQEPPTATPAIPVPPPRVPTSPLPGPESSPPEATGADTAASPAASPAGPGTAPEGAPPTPPGEASEGLESAPPAGDAPSEPPAEGGSREVTPPEEKPSAATEESEEAPAGEAPEAGSGSSAPVPPLPISATVWKRIPDSFFTTDIADSARPEQAAFLIPDPKGTPLSMPLDLSFSCLVGPNYLGGNLPAEKKGPERASEVLLRLAKFAHAVSPAYIRVTKAKPNTAPFAWETLVVGNKLSTDRGIYLRDALFGRDMKPEDIGAPIAYAITFVLRQTHALDEAERAAGRESNVEDALKSFFKQCIKGISGDLYIVLETSVDGPETLKLSDSEKAFWKGLAQTSTGLNSPFPLRGGLRYFQNPQDIVRQFSLPV